jgi:hypothetical protein
LQRIIMTGDVKQLCSIRPGNLLEETEIVMKKLGCFVSFQHNHRVKEAGAEILDSNAKAIASKQIHRLRFDGKHAVHVELGLPESTDWGDNGHAFRQQRFERCRDLVVQTLKKFNLDEYEHIVITRTNDCRRLLNVAIEEHFFNKQPPPSDLYGGLAPSKIIYQPRGFTVQRKMLVKRNLYEIGLPSSVVMRIVAIEDVATYVYPGKKSKPVELTVRLAHTRQGAKMPPKPPPGFAPGTKPDTYQRRLVLVPMGTVDVNKCDKVLLPWVKEIRPLAHKASSVTVHGAQGKQVKTIIYCIPYECTYEDVRSFYTGCTRAQERCVIIGSMKSITAAILRDPPVRNTDLAEKFFALCPIVEQQQPDLPPPLESNPEPLPSSFSLPPLAQLSGVKRKLL